VPEAILEKSTLRVLVVEDYEPFRQFITAKLKTNPHLRIVKEACDGAEVVQQAQELHPDLILIDVSLPTLNGIEAARRIREVSPSSKILFVSENRSPDIAEAALEAGAGGYVVKSDAAGELLPAVKAILEGKRFLSSSIAAQYSKARGMDPARAIGHSHEVAFYADGGSVVNGYARFIESSLKAGNAVIAVVTESHRASLLLKLEALGVDVPEAIDQGSFILFDAIETLSRLTVNDMPDPTLCANVVGELVTSAAKGIKGEHARVEVCGEIAPTLLSKGSWDGAIELERLWDEITRGYGVHTLCGYLSSAFPHPEADPVFHRICSQHSAVHGAGPVP